MRFTVDFTNRSEPTRGLAGNPFIHPSYVYSLLSVWGLCEDLGCQDECNTVTDFEEFTLYSPKLSCSINSLLWHRESAVLVAQSYQTLCDAIDCSPPGSSVGFSSKITGLGSHSLLQGIFLTQGSNLGLLHCGQILYHQSHQGRPWCNEVKVAQMCLILWDSMDYTVHGIF